VKDKVLNLDKSTIFGWASFAACLYFTWRLIQGLCGYDHKTQEFTWLTAFGAWGAIALIFGGLMYLSA
jgi:uncharacterized membrane protein